MHPNEAYAPLLQSLIEQAHQIAILRHALNLQHNWIVLLEAARPQMRDGFQMGGIARGSRRSAAVVKKIQAKKHQQRSKISGARRK